MLKRALQRSVQRTRQFSAVPTYFHRDSDHNNADLPFQFTDENMEKIEQILLKYPPNYKQSAVIPFLFIAQEQHDNWIPLSAMNEIARICNINPMRVYEVATFYTMFNREPVGKFHLQVCGTTPCLVRGSDKIIKALEDHLGIHEGETTDDGMFTLQEVECLACCANAPMLQLNNEEVFEDLTPDSVVSLCQQLQDGTAKPGPQTGRNRCEGFNGRTSLFEPDKIEFVTRDFGQLKAELDEKRRQARE